MGAMARLRQFRLDQPVFAVAPAVQDVDLVQVGVEEDEEVVPQKFHLFDGFRLVHGDHSELFYPHDIRRFFGCFLLGFSKGPTGAGSRSRLAERLPL